MTLIESPHALPAMASQDSALCAVKYYLSMVVDDTRKIRATYQAHQLLWRGFSHIPDTGGVQPFRFRREELTHPSFSARPGAASFLVQSQHAPDWTGLAGLVCQTKTVKLELAQGMRLAFRVRCPIYRSQRDSTGKRTKILIRSSAGIEAWFRERAPTAGFEPFSLTFSAPSRDRLSVPVKDAEARDFSLNAVTFEGVLEVISPQRLAHALCNGFGPKPALGMGLLSVAAA